ncbi:Potassium transporter 5 [Ancistrocladus abbreviatus]
MAEGVVRDDSTDAEVNEGVHQRNVGGRKLSWRTLVAGRVDSLNIEAGRVSHSHGHKSKDSWRRTLSLAFQSIGVIYGDIGTSPLYVYASTFTNGIEDKNDILGVLSLIIYTILLLPMLKYVFIVLWANDNGDGGTFAVYSKLCRYAKVSMIPNYQPEDAQLSNYKLETPTKQLKRAEKIKEKLENSRVVKEVLFLVTILATSMVMGDGVLTPSISVLSAVRGITSLSTIQRFGTDKVGFTFAPIISVWFLFLTGIGLYNLFKYDLGILRAFYPKYIVDYFKRNGKQGWISLGGIFLCITGTEAMFADLGHFSIRAVQISFSSMVCPAIVIAYIGQGAYLMKYPHDVSNTFYASIPGGGMYWPTFVVALLAAIIASQAMISGAFAIISQSQSLSCFPRVKVIHTSVKYEGQVYIPEINYILMLACVLVTIGFKTTDKIGQAYGVAVCLVMLVTTCMLVLIMLVIWKTSIWLIILFFAVFGLIELLYLSSVLYKFKEGGYLPIVLASFLMMIMAIWNYVQRHRYMYELENKVSSESVKRIMDNPKINKVPGIGLLYSELVQGIPTVFPQLINNIPSLHSVFIFVSIKNFPISRVEPEERFLFRRVDLPNYKMFRCVVRYGYNDVNEEPAMFEKHLVENLIDFIQHEHLMLGGSLVEDASHAVTQTVRRQVVGRSAIYGEESLEQDNAVRVSSGSIVIDDLAKPYEGALEEVQFIQNSMHEGVVYLLGETKVIARENSSLLKKIVVNYAYDFLRKNCRQGEDVMAIPHTRLLRVGTTYEI